MPPMGGVTGAMRGTNRRGIGAKAARPKNMKHTVMRLFSYMKKDVWMLAAALLCVVAGTVSTLAASYMLRPIINDYIIPAKTTADLKETGRGINRHAGGVFVGRDGSVFTEPHYAGTFSESTGAPAQ